MPTNEEILEAVTAYRAALRWSSTDAEGVPFDAPFYELFEFTELAQQTAAEEVRGFIKRNLEHLTAFMEVTGRGWGDVGHDFALTRNHHGTGFWDRGAAGPAVDAIVAACDEAGEVNVYVADQDGDYLETE